MREHLHQPDIARLSSRLEAAAEPNVYRHLNQCEPCLRRLIDEVLRLATAEEKVVASAAGH